jgi:hypothetical protein
VAVTNCPTSTKLVTSNDAESAWRLTLTQNLSAVSGTVGLGSAIRIVRRARYQLYKETDGRWYLGYRACNDMGGVTCDALSPVSGPYVPATQDSKTSGLYFTYRDASGTQTTDPTKIARIDILLRSQTETDINMPGRPRGKYVSVDSLSIKVRN